MSTSELHVISWLTSRMEDLASFTARSVANNGCTMS